MRDYRYAHWRRLVFRMPAPGFGSLCTPARSSVPLGREEAVVRPMVGLKRNTRPLPEETFRLGLVMSLLDL